VNKRLIIKDAVRYLLTPYIDIDYTVTYRVAYSSCCHYHQL